jgi:Ca2+-binding EF-hand superfamily protein
MRREMKLIELRRSLIKSDDYSIQGMILSIDSNRHDWVCAEDIYKFMKNHGFDVDNRRVEKLVEVLNYQADGKITQEQLKWTVEGL